MDKLKGILGDPSLLGGSQEASDPGVLSRIEIRGEETSYEPRFRALTNSVPIY